MLYSHEAYKYLVCTAITIAVVTLLFSNRVECGLDNTQMLLAISKQSRAEGEFVIAAKGTYKCVVFTSTQR